MKVCFMPFKPSARTIRIASRNGLRLILRMRSREPLLFQNRSNRAIETTLEPRIFTRPTDHALIQSIGIRGEGRFCSHRGVGDHDLCPGYDSAAGVRYS